MFTETIATERLILRKPKRSDAGAIYRNYGRDPEVTRYLLWEPHGDIADTHAFLGGLAERMAAGTELAWVLTEPGDPDAFGMINAVLEPPGAMIGYVLARNRWGRGYMAEALRAVIDECLARDEIWRAWAYCSVKNPQSARVMEKAGMVYEGTLRRWSRRPGQEPDDCKVYATVR